MKKEEKQEEQEEQEEQAEQAEQEEQEEQEEGKKTEHKNRATYYFVLGVSFLEALNCICFATFLNDSRYICYFTSFLIRSRHMSIISLPTV